ncbi:MAG: hypothetical protein N2484_15280 [Clostridia bacterium]|nr:hypothetical protein [Clostridia bacterium]
MVIKFDRAQIAAINNTQATNITRDKAVINNKKAAVPEKETFKQILENAEKGNEMAAVLIDEWHKSCQPKDDKEKQIYESIRKAANRLFK